MQSAENLVRKQYMISPGQIDKIQTLAEQQQTSAANIVRLAIEAYHPDVPAEIKESELFDLVSARVKEAIKDTRATRKQLQATLNALMEAK